MTDLPTGPALLALARQVLIGELLPALPEELRLEARLVANAMAIAEREAATGRTAAEGVLPELRVLYSALNPTSSPQLLARFARDLRAGTFETSERAARDILWRLTIDRLRRANPRFLTANGFR